MFFVVGLVQFESEFALGYLARGNAENKAAIIKAGAFPVLEQLVGSSDSRVWDQAKKTLRALE